ncbi:MAG: hypothetical protein O3B73_02510 [bacterium]|nr:hypothetical protein [bacterium]
MFWIFLMMFSGVIGAKYFTAVGTRNLERRLNRVKAGLTKARADLKREHDRQAQIGADEEMAEMRVRFMKELMQDLQIRLSGGGIQTKEKNIKDDIAAAVMRF